MWNSCVIWEPNFQVKNKTNGTVSIVEKKLIEKKYITDFLSLVDSEHVSANMESSRFLCQLWLALCLCSTLGRPRRHKFAYCLFSISTCSVYRSLPFSHYSSLLSYIFFLSWDSVSLWSPDWLRISWFSCLDHSCLITDIFYYLTLFIIFWEFVHIYSLSPLTSAPKYKPTKFFDSYFQTIDPSLCCPNTINYGTGPGLWSKPVIPFMKTDTSSPRSFQLIILFGTDGSRILRPTPIAHAWIFWTEFI